MKKIVWILLFLIALLTVLCACQATETTVPITTEAGEPSDLCPPTNPSKSYLFHSYDELQKALLGSENQAFHQTVAQEAVRLTPMLACFTQDNKVPFPKLNNEPMELLGDGYIFLLEESLHNEPFLLYHCEYKGSHVRIRISYLSLFDVENESQKGDVAKLIAAVNPEFPNPNNFEQFDYINTLMDKKSILVLQAFLPESLKPMKDGTIKFIFCTTGFMFK